MRLGRALAAIAVSAVLIVAVMAACTQAESPTPLAVIPASQALEGAGMAEGQTVRVEYPSGLGGQQKGLWASGQGQVKVPPDLALLRVGVRVTEPTVAEANAEAAEALTAMIDVLMESGLGDADIQTSSLDIWEETDGREVTRCPEGVEGADSTDDIEEAAAAVAMAAMIAGLAGFQEESTEGSSPAPATAASSSAADEAMDAVLQEALVELLSTDDLYWEEDDCYTTWEQVVVGYTVSQQLNAKIRDLDSIGETIDQLVEAGGDLTRIDGIYFTIEDPAPLMEQARQEAIEDMLARAQKMADAAGATLGDLEYLSESGASVLESGEESYLRAMPAAMAFDSAGPSTPVSAGEVTVTANVTGAFDISD